LQFLAIILTGSGNLNAQSSEKSALFEYGTWALLQTVPSPVFFHDNDGTQSRLQFGLRWNISPVNYSFNANPLVSPVQFFKVNPVRRYGGSVEAFLQPEWATGAYQFSDLDRFDLTAGARVFIPAIESGEYLSFSAGGKYKIRKDREGNTRNCYSVELGSYTLLGSLGFQFNYNFDSQSKYDFGLWLKYY
jgi:hypothetical protein